MQLPPSLYDYLQVTLNCKILQSIKITGGDINEVAQLITNRGTFFIKYNRHSTAKKMLETERLGLEKLAATKSIKIPQIFFCAFDELDDYQYLLLEFIPSDSPPPSSFWIRFGRQLAQLHQTTNATFGLDYDNFIGNLRQSNQRHDNWIDFFIEERLVPQIKLAADQQIIDNQHLKLFKTLFNKLNQILPIEAPALIHGDLWSGNFICSDQYQPYLIDPAIYYGHREMDLAMTRLFGGFNPQFYDSYKEEFPLENGFRNRMEIYQLYPLLVHVNLFGGGYWQSVQQIIRKFI